MPVTEAFYFPPFHLSLAEALPENIDVPELCLDALNRCGQFGDCLGERCVRYALSPRLRLRCHLLLDEPTDLLGCFPEGSPNRFKSLLYIFGDCLNFLVYTLKYSFNSLVLSRFCALTGTSAILATYRHIAIAFTGLLVRRIL